MHGLIDRFHLLPAMQPDLTGNRMKITTITFSAPHFNDSTRPGMTGHNFFDFIFKIICLTPHRLDTDGAGKRKVPWFFVFFICHNDSTKMFANCKDAEEILIEQKLLRISAVLRISKQIQTSY